MFGFGRLPRFGALFLLFGAMSFVVGGCIPEGGPSTSALSTAPEDVQLRQQAEDFNRTMVEGAVAGAVVGALIGGLIGGGRGALIGSIGGLALGTAAGAYVANKKKQYATAEDRIKAEIADVHADNEKAAVALATQAKVIDRNRERLAELQAAARGNTAMVAELKAEVARSQEARALVSKSIDGLKKRRDEYQNAATAEGAEPGVDALNGEIGELNRKIGDMEAKLKQLDDAIAVSGVS